MNSSLPTKTVSFSQTKHLAVAPFPMMLFKGFVWFKSFGSACRNDGLRQGMFRENFSSGSTGSSWRLVPFRGKHQKRLGIHK
jgi:hypothetical protein